MDRILDVNDFRIGDVQRTRNVISQPGGKGSNVARVFRQLGGEVVLIGLAGRRTAEWIRQPLQSIGVHLEVIDAYEGETRTCTIIRDSSTNNHPTVINEESPEIEQHAIEEIENRIDRWLARADGVLVTGSLTRGLPSDFYGRLIERASAKGIITAIDAAGDVMKRGLNANPVLAKSNLDEIGTVLGRLGTEPIEIARALAAHSHLPAQMIVTIGEAGAILVTRDQSWFAQPPRISHVNPIGAGDAFAAGYLKAYLDGSPPDTALRFATAVAASDAATPEPGRIIPAEITALLAATLVRAL